MDIDDRLLTDIKGMIKIAGQKGNIVVGPDDSDIGSINNEELSSALISYTTRRHQLDQPPTSFVQLPQPQQQRRETIATTKGRR